MDLIQALGELAFASRLKRLSERLMRDVAQVYAAEDVTFEPRWFPVLYLLRTQSPLGITEIATTLGVTHPAVNQIAAAMTRRGLLVSSRDRHDDRRRLLALSPAGRALGNRLQGLWSEIEAATRELLEAEAPQLLPSVERLERSLDRQGIAARVHAARLQRRLARVEIVPFEARWRADFERLNREWIETYFTIEPHDEEILTHPEDIVLRRGGTILFAVLEGQPIGTLALIPRAAGEFELAKMAVTAQARGAGVGRRLAQAAIAWARNAGARTLVLHTSPALAAANRLYRSLGFRIVRARDPRAAAFRRPTHTMRLGLHKKPTVPASRRKK